MTFHPTLKMITKIVLTILGALAVVSFLLFLIGKPQKDITWGITFSTIRAEELGFEPQALLSTIIKDLNPDKIRIPVYWSEIEPEQGKFNFSKYDALLAETSRTGTEVILVLGKKQPRWPECHQPDWYNHLVDEATQDKALLNMMEKSIAQFQDVQSVVGWQIENEPYFPYGPRCPVTDSTLYEKQIALVQQLDNKPIISTDSGEKGAWVNVAWSGANVLGATMYREVYHDKKERYITYPLPWWTYNIKAGLVKLLTGADEVIGVELQTEPWLKVSNPEYTPPAEQLNHMNADIFKNNVDYAVKVGFSENYLWGVEWWYWMQKKHGDESVLNAAKEFFNKN